MRQLYYTVQILLRGRGSNFIKLVSLTLGLLIGILLFSQIAYELSYENFYKDPENVALMRCRRVKEGIPDKDYDDSTFRPAAADIDRYIDISVFCILNIRRFVRSKNLYILSVQSAHAVTEPFKFIIRITDRLFLYNL